MDSRVVSLFFSEKDLCIIPNCKSDPDDEDSEFFTRYMYKTNVLHAKERLDAMGFGLKCFEIIFNTRKFQAIDYAGFLGHLHVDIDDYEQKARERITNKVSFKKWQNAMRKIIEYELIHGNVGVWSGADNGINITTECDKVIYYAHKDDDTSSYYGLFTEIVPEAYVFRLMLENCNDEDEIVLDFTNLGYWDEDCISKGIEATKDIEKIIVLVEGTSDKDILEYALQKIYPHLSDLLYFMDFDDTRGGRRDGGTSFVIKNLKTFYFSHIKSKFIAVFDNDAEGYSSKCTLLNEIKNWPENFRILLYPEIELFNAYPTLIPNGSIMQDNINKKACSIELYLPDSLIKSEDGYYPIEWETRKKIKTEDGTDKAFYQGVISHKNDIKTKFHEMRNSIEKGEQIFEIDEWQRMQILLKSIVFAFAKVKNHKN